MTVNVVLMQLRKKGLPVVSLEETLEADDEAPRKEFGTKDLRLTGSVDRLQLQRAIDKLPPAIERFLCCTMWKGLSITRLPNGGLLDWQQQVAAPQGTIEAAGFLEVHESRKGQDWIVKTG